MVQAIPIYTIRGYFAYYEIPPLNRCIYNSICILRIDVVMNYRALLFLLCIVYAASMFEISTILWYNNHTKKYNSKSTRCSISNCAFLKKYKKRCKFRMVYVSESVQMKKSNPFRDRSHDYQMSLGFQRSGV